MSAPESLDRLLCILFPRRCAYCGEVILPKTHVCDACLENLPRILPPICPFCAYQKEDCRCKQKKREYGPSRHGQPEGSANSRKHLMNMIQKHENGSKQFQIGCVQYLPLKVSFPYICRFRPSVFCFPVHDSFLSEALFSAERAPLSFLCFPSSPALLSSSSADTPYSRAMASRFEVLGSDVPVSHS